MRKMKGYRKVTVLGNLYYWNIKGGINIISVLNDKKKYYKFSMEKVNNINNCDMTIDNDDDYYDYEYCITPSKICAVICLEILGKTRAEMENILFSPKERKPLRFSSKSKKTIEDYRREYDYYLKNDINFDNIQYGLFFHYWELEGLIPVKKEKVINCFSNPKFVKEICSILNGLHSHNFRLTSFKNHLMPDYNSIVLKKKELLEKFKNGEDFKECFSTRVVV